VSVCHLCVSRVAADGYQSSTRQSSESEEVDAELVLQRTAGEVEARLRHVSRHRPDGETRSTSTASIVVLVLLMVPRAQLGRVERVWFHVAAENVHVRHRLPADDIAAGPGAVAVAGAVAGVGDVCGGVGDDVHASEVVGPEGVRGAVGGALLHCRHVGHGQGVEADGRGVWRRRVAAGGGDGEAVFVGGKLLAVVARLCRGGCGVLDEWLVRAGVDAALPELLLDARIPEVLDLVVRPAGQLRCDLGPPDHITINNGAVSMVNHTGAYLTSKR
jgi:hypothetical protein